ncbi:helix-turn-helix domain-containing protein [Enterococcus faecium]|nr:helix-turn-helix domain-containing protein [Enterococcus faecium]
MGQTIHSYIQERKINESKHLLLFTDKSYKEISVLLSFASQSHFIQVFKKQLPLRQENTAINIMLIPSIKTIKMHIF